MFRHHVSLIFLFGLTTLLFFSPARSVQAAPQIYVNSIGMEFVKIPAGSFTMGAGPDDKDASSNEKPQHWVSISRDFFLGRFEVTQEQWKKVMGTNPSKFQGAKNPVEQVSWEDVQEFIRRLNEMEGTVQYRLPSESEWEYAARSGGTARFSFGNDASELGKHAWYSDNSKNSTQPVGQKQPNSWGLYDMHGNVYEWVGIGMRRIIMSTVLRLTHKGR